MTLSNITHRTIVLNGTSLELTGIFGLVLYIFVFWVIFSSVAKSSESQTGSRLTPTDIIFLSFGLNDCIGLAWYIVAGIRASLKDVTLKLSLIHAAAYVYVGSRICKRYHISLLVISRIIVLRGNHKQLTCLGRSVLIIVLLIVWIGSYGMTYPILEPPYVTYSINYFTINVRNTNVQDYFFLEEIVSTACFVIMTLGLLPWMIYKYITYRKPQQNRTGTNMFVLTTTAEVTRFVQETRKSVTTLYLVGFYIVCAICSWILAQDDGVEEAKRSDKTYMVKYFFGVYFWCLNSALTPTVYIIVEQVMQKIFAKFFEKKFNNQVVPAEAPNAATVQVESHQHIDSEQASSIVVFPMLDAAQRDMARMLTNRKFDYTAFSTF